MHRYPSFGNADADSLALRLFMTIEAALGEALVACRELAPIPVPDPSTWQASAGDERQHRQAVVNAIFAKAFVAALSTSRKAIHELGLIEGCPGPTAEACRRFEKEYFYLTSARDTFAHPEQRMLGRGRRREPLPGGVIALGAFVGPRTISATAEDGTMVHIEVSDAMLERFRTSVDQVLETIPSR